MMYRSITDLVLALASFATLPVPTFTHPPPLPFQRSTDTNTNSQTNISIPLFAELEELSRIVDISYCVGTTGIFKPFSCASRCHEFPDFELVDTFNTGPLMSDSCGYVVLDHGRGRLGRGRILVAFRGTYSIANTIVDLSTVPQEYVPYPGGKAIGDESQGEGEDGIHRRPMMGRERHRFSWRDFIAGWGRHRTVKESVDVQSEEKRGGFKCTNCTVHTGFWKSWQNTRPFILPYINILHEKYPHYRLDLVGHSLGGAVAALAGLELQSSGFEPTITTFGEPKIGNAGLRDYIDATFGLPSEHGHDHEDHDGLSGERGVLKSGRYRRVTHVGDPVPFLPLREWGYRSHAGEHFISKAELQPTISDIRLCFGDEDVNCLAAAEIDKSWFNFHRDSASTLEAVNLYNEKEGQEEFERQSGRQGDEENRGEEQRAMEKRWGLPIPARYKMWQLFFAHRNYFWRLGLCVPGGDPLDWGRDKYKFGDGEESKEGQEERGEREEL